MGCQCLQVRAKQQNSIHSNHVATFVFTPMGNEIFEKKKVAAVELYNLVFEQNMNHSILQSILCHQ